MHRVVQLGLIPGAVAALLGFFPAAVARALPPQRAAAGDADDLAAPPKRRPGVKQIEAPEAPDEALEDPEAARRKQFFGAMPPLPFPGMAIPGFPQGAFPFVPPGAGAAAGAGNGAGVGVVQQFGFSGVVVGGNAVPGGNGFVVRTFQIGPDGAVKEMPQPEPPAADRGQREPGKAKAKPKDAAAAAAERAPGKAKAAAARDDKAKGAKAPRAKPNAKVPRAAAAPE